MGQVDEDKKQGARDRLLESAIDIFGRYGYESATTRLIAKAAEVNIAAIPYYFGGKEGLYREVINHIVMLVQHQAGSLLAGWGADERVQPVDSNAAFALLQELLEKMVDFIVGSEQGQRIARIILREQMYPSEAYDLIYTGFMEPVLGVIAGCVMSICDETSWRQAKLRALAIMGQVLAFRVARETIVRSLALHGYDSRELQEIRAIIVAHTRAILGFEMQP